MSRVARKSNTTKILIVTPVVVVAMVLGGAFLGLWLGAPLGVSGAVLGAVFGTLGLFASLPIIVKLVQWFVRQETAGG